MYMYTCTCKYTWRLEQLCYTISAQRRGEWERGREGERERGREDRGREERWREGERGEREDRKIGEELL